MGPNSPQTVLAASVDSKEAISKVGFLSIAAPCFAYVLTLLPSLGMKSMLLFYYFAPLTRMIGAGLGVLLGIVACMNAPSLPRARTGIAGIALGLGAFVAALYLALSKIA